MNEFGEGDGFWAAYLRDPTNHETRGALLGNPRLKQYLEASLCNPVHRKPSLDLIREVDAELKKALMSHLLELAVYPHGLAAEFEAQLFSIDRTWLIAHIEVAAEKVIASDAYTDLCGLLHIYRQLDPNLVQRLSARLKSHPDPEIQALSRDASY